MKLRVTAALPEGLYVLLRSPVMGLSTFDSKDSHSENDVVICRSRSSGAVEHSLTIVCMFVFFFNSTTVFSFFSCFPPLYYWCILVCVHQRYSPYLLLPLLAHH